jgi:hypothetical protein
MKAVFGICFQTVVSALVAPYYRTVHRFRIWGRLPSPRGSTLLLCNHQHDLDNAPTIAMMQLGGPWDRPIYSAAGRRMFEPGFIAMRLPLLRSALRHVDSSKLFLAIGMVPIENEIRSRALASLAWWVYERHGDVQLGQVVAPEVIERFDPAAAHLPVSRLFGSRWFEKANTMRVSIKSVLEPYRAEIMAQTREHLEPDYRRFEELLSHGNTLYLTPEGHYSTDGRLGRLQAALTRFLPFARDVYLLAISYDVYASQRLSCLIRIVKPLDLQDLEHSMCAPRAVTTSQLLCSWLLQHEHVAFTAEEAVAAVQARLATLPAEAFVDPEFARAPRTRTLIALRELRRLGTLVEEEGRSRLSAVRTHPQFPHVADMVAFQARFFDETLAALERLAGRRS